MAMPYHSATVCTSSRDRSILQAFDPPPLPCSAQVWCVKLKGWCSIAPTLKHDSMLVHPHRRAQCCATKSSRHLAFYPPQATPALPTRLPDTQARADSHPINRAPHTPPRTTAPPYERYLCQSLVHTPPMVAQSCMRGCEGYTRRVKHRMRTTE